MACMMVGLIIGLIAAVMPLEVLTETMAFSFQE
jgi:hypothetical protein